MPLKHYQELVAWQLAMDFTEEVHRLTRSFPRDEIFALTSQVRRAAVSVPSNIAERQGRGSTREFLHHLNIARGSLYEAETQLILAQRLGYLRSDVAEGILVSSDEVSRVLGGLIRSMEEKLAGG